MNVDTGPHPETVLPGAFVTVLLPRHRDIEQFVHEVITVLSDLFDITEDHWSVAIHDHGAVLCVGAKRGRYVQVLNEALSRVADRYRVPAIFWTYGDLQTAEAPEAAEMLLNGGEH